LPTSSFGQVHDKVRGQYVEEALLKLVPIAPGIAVAFAGDVELAGEIIEYLQEKLPFAETFEDLFDFLNIELGPFPSNRPVQLLFAASSKDNKTDLLFWDSIQGIAKQNFDFCQIGSLAFTSHANNTTFALNVLAKGHIPVEDFLPAMSAMVQSYGVHNNIIDKNAGGIIFGLRSHDGIISWQEDTNYILYNPSFSQLNFVSAFVRDNVLVVSSSFVRLTKIFSHPVSTLSFERWRENWEADIRVQQRSDRYRYWVFIETANRLITLIRREKFEIQSKYVNLDYLGDGQFDLGLSPELKMKLLLPLADRGDGSRPFRFNFLPD